MTLSSKTILVISDANSLKKLNNNELIKKFDTLLFYDNNHIEKFKLSRYKSTSGRNKKRILRIITAKALKDELNYFHKNTFEYFLSKNLPPNANKYTTLAVLLKNKSETEKLFFYVFNNSKKDIENKEKIKITTYKRNNKLKENHKYVNTNRNENNTSNISENNNNNTTKCDSYFKENKDSKNVKMRTKSKTLINNVENNSKKEKKDEKDISLKGIEYIVSTVQIKHKFRAQKRKTNQIKKDLFTDNYNYDFQKVTGKISRAITNLKNC